ncbi:MAG: methyltransferase [Lacipirellulaceae bacterium]
MGNTSPHQPQPAERGGVASARQRGAALAAAGRVEEAIGAYLAHVAQSPGDAAALAELGRLLLERGLAEAAAEHLSQALVVDPSFIGALPDLADAELRLGRRGRARETLARWVADAPDDPVRRHLSAARLGEVIPPRAPDAYVRRLFDDYAPRFDASLARLGYRGPQLVEEALEAANFTRGVGSALDLGCGTGLVGRRIRTRAELLVGVDLSPAMLRVAGASGAYDFLFEEELVRFLRSTPGLFDIITAADVLTYLGDLADFAAAVAPKLVPGGVVILVVEEAPPGAAAASGYVLGTHGRYAHCRDYLQQTLERAGLLPERIVASPMRRQGGRPIASLVVTGRA